MSNTSSQPYGEGSPPGSGDVYLRLHHTEIQRDAFQKALHTEVLKVMRVAVIQATIDADNEIARLRSEADTIGAQLVELDDIKEQNKLVREEADRYVKLWQGANNEIYGLKAQVAALIDYQARLKAELAKSEEHNGALCERAQDLGSEVHTASCANANMHKENASLQAQVGDFESFLKWEGLGARFQEWKRWRYQKGDAS